MAAKPEVRRHGPETELGTDDGHVEPAEWAEPNLKGDWTNLSLLLLLYVMQGVPLGLFSAVPVIIQSNKSVTYRDQAVLSISGYPFSLKILWAPIVDALYVRRFGRRKSWLVPVQYLIGIILIYAASRIDSLLPEIGKPDILSLVCVFTSTSFLVATQDIAVDGWSLTILKKNNVGYASVCNLTGLAIGVLMGSMPLVLLTSEKFCNQYLRSTPELGVGGIVTMKTMLFGWGLLYMAITTLVAVLKKEEDCTLRDDHVEFNVFQSYSLLWYIMKIPSVQILSVMMLTVKFGFAPSFGDIVSLKLIKAGISKELITVMSSTLNGVNIILPIVMAKFILRGPNALTVFLNTAVLRLPMNIAFALLVFYTSQLPTVGEGIEIPTIYYVVLAVSFFVQNVIGYAMFVTLIYFFNRISDVRFGGTYMTLLNTVHNLGYKWANTVALALIDPLTINDCSIDPADDNNCCAAEIVKTNAFSFRVDGYYVEVVLCTVVGIIWYFVFRSKVKRLQTENPSSWFVELKNPMGTGNHAGEEQSAVECC